MCVLLETIFAIPRNFAVAHPPNEKPVEVNCIKIISNLVGMLCGYKCIKNVWARLWEGQWAWLWEGQWVWPGGM